MTTPTVAVFTGFGSDGLFKPKSKNAFPVVSGLNVNTIFPGVPSENYHQTGRTQRKESTKQGRSSKITTA
jgi:hypothetical protein